MPDANQLARPSQEEMRFWKVFEGQSLDGFPLDGYVAPEHTGATFASRLPGEDQPVLIKVVRYGSAGWERFSASWALAKQLQHPHLVRVYACGQGNLDGLRVAYAVTEYPEAKLVDVLKERRLTEDEGQEILLNCAGALHYLHQRGLAHSHVQPATVLAVGETSKLASDHLTKAGQRELIPTDRDPYGSPELATQGYSAATDVWSLGLTMLQALTGVLPDRDAIVSADPRTYYADIVRRCLAPKPEGRCSARQILTSLQELSKERAQAFDNEEAPRSAGYSSPRSRYEAQPPARVTLLARARYAVPAVGILLLTGFWLASSQGRRVEPGSTVSGRVTSLPKKIEQGDADRADRKPIISPPTAVTAEVVKPSPPPVAAKSSAAPVSPRTWSVVVYTYAQSDSAQHKAAEINKRWPRLAARVLQTKDGTSNLVVLGSETDRAAALKLRHQALAAKLPRDSYIQNF